MKVYHKQAYTWVDYYDKVKGNYAVIQNLFMSM